MECFGVWNRKCTHLNLTSVPLSSCSRPHCVWQPSTPAWCPTASVATSTWSAARASLATSPRWPTTSRPLSKTPGRAHTDPLSPPFLGSSCYVAQLWESVAPALIGSVSSFHSGTLSNSLFTFKTSGEFSLIASLTSLCESADKIHDCQFNWHAASRRS